MSYKIHREIMNVIGLKCLGTSIIDNFVVVMGKDITEDEKSQICEKLKGYKIIFVGSEEETIKALESYVNKKQVKINKRR